MSDGIADDLRSSAPGEPLGRGSQTPASAPLSAKAHYNLGDLIAERDGLTATERWEMEPPDFWAPDDPDPVPTERHRRAF
jgi:hypothetical protein